MIPILFIGGILALLFWNPGRFTAPIRSQNLVGNLENDFYPSPGDIVTVAFLEKGIFSFLNARNRIPEIIHLFAARGYHVQPLEEPTFLEPEVYSVPLRVTEGPSVLGRHASIAIPRRISPNFLVTSVTSMS